MKSFYPAALAAAAAAALWAGTVQAVPYTITATNSLSDFGAHSAGASVNQYALGQRGVHWSVVDEFNTSPGSYDQRVVTMGANNVLRMSNAVTTGSFSNQPWSPSVAAAGEAGASLHNDRGTDHTAPLNPPNPNGTVTANNRFFFSFDFGSFTGATQSGLFLSVSAGPRQSSFRQTYIGLQGDIGGGLGVNFIDYAVGGSTFNTVQVASGLNPAAMHQIAMEVLFLDGLNPDGSGNDIVRLYVNGALAHTGTTWETFHRWTTPGVQDQIAVDAIMFRAGGTAVPGTSGSGFFFDNVLLTSGPATQVVPAPSTIALLVAGLLAALAVSRRRPQAR